MREDWLSLTLEDALEPELPICDAHHHLLSEEPYLVDEFLRDAAGGHNIVRTVHVESDSAHYRTDGPEELRSVGETEFVLAQAAAHDAGPPDVAAGIVGFADLTLGEAVVPVLEAHIAAADGRFRGVRQSRTWHDSPVILSWAPTPNPLADRAFRAGFAHLERYELTFDAWIFHTQLPELASLAAAFPGTVIVLDHLGGPLGVGPYYGRRDEVFAEWKRSVSALASFENVVVKLGGLGMPMCGFRWRKADVPPGSTELAEAMAPYYRWCIDRFGAERCMFESNFPADKVSYSYTVLWNAFKRIAHDLSAAERAALFHDTATRVYRL